MRSMGFPSYLSNKTRARDPQPVWPKPEIRPSSNLKSDLLTALRRAFWKFSTPYSSFSPCGRSWRFWQHSDGSNTIAVSLSLSSLATPEALCPPDDFSASDSNPTGPRPSLSPCLCYLSPLPKLCTPPIPGFFLSSILRSSPSSGVQLRWLFYALLFLFGIVLPHERDGTWALFHLSFGFLKIDLGFAVLRSYAVWF